MSGIRLVHSNARRERAEEASKDPLLSVCVSRRAAFAGLGLLAGGLSLGLPEEALAGEEAGSLMSPLAARALSRVSSFDDVPAQTISINPLKTLLCYATNVSTSGSLRFGRRLPGLWGDPRRVDRVLADVSGPGTSSVPGSFSCRFPNCGVDGLNEPVDMLLDLGGVSRTWIPDIEGQNTATLSVLDSYSDPAVSDPSLATDNDLLCVGGGVYSGDYYWGVSSTVRIRIVRAGTNELADGTLLFLMRDLDIWRSRSADWPEGFDFLSGVQAGGYVTYDTKVNATGTSFHTGVMDTPDDTDSQGRWAAIIVGPDFSFRWSGEDCSSGLFAQLAHAEPLSVSFVVVDLAGNQTKVYSEKIVWGTSLTTSHRSFGTADAEVSRRWPGISLGDVTRWHTDASVTSRFTSKTMTGNLTLYARLPPTLTFVVLDGSGGSHTVHSQAIPYRTDLTTSHGAFSSADAEVSKRWPGTPIGDVTRWYTDTSVSNRFSRQTMTGNLTLYARLPATVHFVYVKVDGGASEVHSYKVTSGTTVRSSDAGFSAADSKLKAELGVETLDYTSRWHTAKAGGSKFTSQRVLQDLWVYARPRYGAVAYYVDGTAESDIVVLPDGSKALYPNVPLGTRIEVKAEVTEAARRPNCTPGLTAWYTDPDDPAISSDALPSGVGALCVKRAGLMSRAGAVLRRAVERAAPGYSRFTSAILTKPLLALYGVNRATITFALTDDSVTPRGDVTYRTGPSESMAAGDVSVPGVKVARVDRATPLPSRDTVFEPQEGGRWRTLSPYFWWKDSAGTDGTITMATIERDTTLYLRWRYRTTDGIVDRRQ